MVDLLVKPVEERVQRLKDARESMKPLLFGEEAQRRFQNECETVFSKFRLTVMHLRKEPDALSSVDEKDVITRYVGIVCKQRPFLHDRCEEVLRILMLSDEWMAAFTKEAELDLDHLPPGIKEEFKKRMEKVKEKDPAAAKDPEKRPQPGHSQGAPSDPWSKAAPEPAPGKPVFPGHGVAGAMRVVVQRCAKAKLRLDEFAGSWAEMGSGLVVAVSFIEKADKERVQYAAKFLLTAKLSTSGVKKPGGGHGKRDADSVANLCRRGEEQGILLMPQSSLDSEFEETKDDENPFMYPNRAKREAAKEMYELLVSSLMHAAQEVVSGPGAKEPRIVAGSFSDSQFLEMTSAGPFMHTFMI